MKKIFVVISLLFVINSISGCGIKGRLYIEDEPQTQTEQEEQKHPLILQEDENVKDDDSSSQEMK